MTPEHADDILYGEHSRSDSGNFVKPEKINDRHLADRLRVLEEERNLARATENAEIISRLAKPMVKPPGTSNHVFTTANPMNSNLGPSARAIMREAVDYLDDKDDWVWRMDK